MWRAVCFLAATCALCLLPSCSCSAEGVWVEPSSAAQRPNARKPSRNSVFDGKKAVIAAGRNETEGLVVRARGVGGRVAVSDLKGDGGAVIPASSIEVFELARAAGGLLDAIVPRKTVVLADGGAALVRFHVPADAAPGLYRGTIAVGERSLPLELTVWAHRLPSQVTFFRNSPGWSTATPNKAAGLAGARSELAALWRARLTPAHAFWGKRPWWHFERSMNVSPDDAWPGTDDFYGDYFRRGGMQIDLDWYYAYPHGIRMKGLRGNRANAIRYLRTAYAHIEKKFGAGARVFVQTRADEPTIGQGKPGRQHCEYARAIEWSRIVREAVPSLKILMAEHPAPQLFEWVDIFNSPWTHARGPDARELEKMGKRLIWYSPDIKTPDKLHLLRVTYWRAFANNLHGAWTWERYHYMKGDGANYRQACIYRPGSFEGIPPEIAVASMKLEAAGEGHDDFETLRLLERWAGDRFAALSFAQHTLKRTGPSSPPDATDLAPGDFAPLRRTLAFLLASKHVKTLTFKDPAAFARLDNVELIAGDTGVARLRPADVSILSSGSSLDGVAAIGNAKARIDDGTVRVEMAGGTAMSGADFAGERLSPAREVRFEIKVTPNPKGHDGLANLGLFDIYLRIDGRYGVGVNWKTGEYNRTLGHWSDNGSFPGKWRNVRCVLAHTIGAPRGAASVGIAIGRHGYFDTNDPLPRQRYVVHVRNVRVTSLAHRGKGVVETHPVALPAGQAYVWWVTERPALPGTSTRLEIRRGEGDFRPVEPLVGFMGLARVPDGNGDAVCRITLAGRQESPCVHAVGFVAE